MLRLTDTTDGRAPCNSAIQRDPFAKNLESAWQPVMSPLLGTGMLQLHHGLQSVTVTQCHCDHILTDHYALYHLSW